MKKIKELNFSKSFVGLQSPQTDLSLVAESS